MAGVAHRLTYCLARLVGSRLGGPLMKRFIAGLGYIEMQDDGCCCLSFHARQGPPGMGAHFTLGGLLSLAVVVTWYLARVKAAAETRACINSRKCLCCDVDGSALLGMTHLPSQEY